MFDCRSMVAPLRRVVVRRPGESFANADPGEWHYTARPDLEAARREHDDFVRTIAESGAEVIYHDESMEGLADSIYVHDPTIVTDAGAVILRMGKELRRGEEDGFERLFQRIGVPVQYRLSGDAVA